MVHLLLALLIAGCAGSPTPPPSTEPGSPRPYQVMGKWYRPMAEADGFSQTGIASWYGKKFHGRKTANGETYDMYGISAAHKTLPLGTWVEVENRDNDRRLKVRINDRGPFVAGRVIDLSYGAAKRLGVVGPGTARVRLTALGEARQTAQGVTYLPLDYDSGRFTIQVGAFKVRENAERLQKKLDPVYRNVHIVPYQHDIHGTLYGVRIGLATSLKQAQDHKQALRAKGFDGAFTIAE